MIAIGLFAPFFFFPLIQVLGLDLSVDPQTPPPNSNINIIWDTSDLNDGPFNFTLILTDPNAQQTTHNVVVRNPSGHLSGSEDMSVGPVGRYSVVARWPIRPPNTEIGSFSFQVLPSSPPSTIPHSSTSPPAAPASTSSKPVQVETSSTHAEAPPGTSVETNGVKQTDHSDSTTLATTNTSASSTSSSGSTLPSVVTSKVSVTLDQPATTTLTGSQIVSSSSSPFIPPPVESHKTSIKTIVAGSVCGFFFLIICVALIVFRRRIRRRFVALVKAAPYTPVMTSGDAPQDSSLPNSTVSADEPPATAGNTERQMQIAVQIASIMQRIAARTGADPSSQQITDGQLMEELEEWTQRYESISGLPTKRRVLPPAEDNNGVRVSQTNTEPPPYPSSQVGSIAAGQEEV